MEDGKKEAFFGSDRFELIAYVIGEECSVAILISIENNTNFFSR